MKMKSNRGCFRCEVDKMCFLVCAIRDHLLAEGVQGAAHAVTQPKAHEELLHAAHLGNAKSPVL